MSCFICGSCYHLCAQRTDQSYRDSEGWCIRDINWLVGDFHITYYV